MALYSAVHALRLTCVPRSEPKGSTRLPPGVKLMLLCHEPCSACTQWQVQPFPDGVMKPTHYGL